MAGKRNYGIDLLRLVLMYMVCMLHTLGRGGILDAYEKGSKGFAVFWVIELFSLCAVDGFALISGYMASDRPRKNEKIVEMWFQVFFYSFGVTMIMMVAGLIPTMKKIEILQCAMPVTYGKFWYFTAFFVLFLVTPLLNKWLFSIDERTARRAFVFFVILFCCFGFIKDTFKLNNGYSTFWLIILYCIGAMAKRGNVFKKKKTITLVAMLVLCIAAAWVLYVIVGYTKIKSYLPLPILGSGLLLVILFSRINIKGAIVSKLSPFAFGIYLFQLNQGIWGKLNEAFTFVTEHRLIVAIGYAFALAGLIFISGLVVEFVRSLFAKLFRIPWLSKKIANAAEWAIDKSTALLN